MRWDDNDNVTSESYISSSDIPKGSKVKVYKMSMTEGYEDNLNARLIKTLEELQGTPIFQIMPMLNDVISQLEEYSDAAQQEVISATGDRALIMHNTTKEIYNTQIALIEQLIESLNDEKHFRSQAYIAELIDQLGIGEILG